ncbi:NAD-dependent epimerase/dehydratase family protein [Promethearchaeum syntrophicum]|uniref:NAD-dependent epimerase/dehydratase family protein n=1 Tax=Promethearchaeum syntrophicum TaxID=2594042 RepID=A0A5B9DB38_9ARCH|nr:NAD-dependent epimerase/dehydratase family protein [Candidatus Prometheoarchaeum syntrophicum]QEE16047.1 dTDP-glucose 4,6-dehydratase [Candidatus Prometheoarchaeum syntrophicum]
MDDYLKYYKDKIVVITGGAGAIGSNLTKKLIELDAFVIVVDDLSSSYEWNLPQNATNLLFIKGDIADDIVLKRIFNEKPDLLFHLAAFFANQNSVDYPEKDLNTNGFGTLKLLEYSAIYGKLQRFVYASSGCSIYPTNAEMPYKEELTNMYMTTPYQITKMLGELYCNYFFKIKKVPTVKARFFNSFGPGEVPGQYRNVIPNFIFWAKSGLPLPITGTGEETRDFTFVGDIVDGLIRMGYYKEAIGQEMNLAAGREVKIIDLAQLVNNVTNNKAGIKYLPRRNWDAKSRMLASNEKAKSLIGFKADPNFKECLNLAVKWFDEHWNQIEASADFPPGTSSAVRGK